MDLGEKKKKEDHDINKGSFYIKDLCKLFFFFFFCIVRTKSQERKKNPLNQSNSIVCEMWMKRESAWISKGKHLYSLCKHQECIGFFWTRRMFRVTLFRMVSMVNRLTLLLQNISTYALIDIISSLASKDQKGRVTHGFFMNFGPHTLCWHDLLSVRDWIQTLSFVFKNRCRTLQRA